MNLFAKKPDVKEVVRGSQRELRSGGRALDRELLALRREEAKLVTDIKAAAKRGDQASAKVLARSLVRLRAQITKLQASAANLRGVATNLTTAAAATTVASSMATATGAMGRMQAQLNPARIGQTAQAFARENARMDMAQEMMGDTIDGALDGESAEEDAGELVSQVLDEIGVDLSAALGTAPTRRIAAPAAATRAEEAEEGEDLAARLAALRS